MSTRRIMLCPGQGAQKPDMGHAWFDASAEAAQTFGAADQILKDQLGARLSEICFSADAETINRTDIAQPAIFTVSVACYQALVAREPEDDRAELAATAGLSLGEYTALHIAGAMSFADALQVVALRGKAMQEAAEAQESSMVALIGADEEQASTLCETAAHGGVLVPANYNAPGQIVISGDNDACDRAVEQAGNLGLRAQKLAVAGAFHSPLMAPAAEALEAALQRVELSVPLCPVLSNVTGMPHGHDEPDQASIISSIRRRLVEQLTSPVRWAQGCRWLADNIEGEMHELAPGKTLAGLMRRIERSIKVTTHDIPEA